MKTSKKIISCFLAFAIALSLCVVPAYSLDPNAAASVGSISDTVYYFGKLVAHVFFPSTVCPEAGGVNTLHSFVPQMVMCNDGQMHNRYVCEHCGFDSGQEVSDENNAAIEDAYVQSLPATGITSTGLYYFYPTYSDYKIVSFADYQKSTKSVLKVYPDCTYELTSSYASSFADINVFSYNPLTFAFNDSVGITTVEFTGSSVPTVFQVPISGVYNKMPLQFSGTAGYGGFGNFPFSCSFTFPTGNYDLTVGSAISHMDASYTLPTAKRASDGATLSRMCTSLVCTISDPYYSFTPSIANSVSVSNYYDYSTRIGQYINNISYGDTVYNNVQIVNEENNTFYSPITNETYNVTNWDYDYTNRAYNLTLGNGFTAIVTYGDTCVTIAVIDENGQIVSTDYNYYAAPAPDPDPDPVDVVGDITESARVGYRDGYIRYANQVLNLSGVATESTQNGLVVFNVSPNTTYRVSMLMQNRFRVGTLATLENGLTVENYIYSPLDNNDSTNQGTVQSLEITTGANDVYLVVGAWSTGAGDTIFNTLDTVTLCDLTPSPPNPDPATGTDTPATGSDVDNSAYWAQWFTRWDFFQMQWLAFTGRLELQLGNLNVNIQNMTDNSVTTVDQSVQQITNIASSSDLRQVFYIQKADGSEESILETSKDSLKLGGRLLSMFYRLIFGDALSHADEVLNGFESEYTSGDSGVNVWS